MNKLLKLLSENSKYTASELALILSEPEDYIKAQIKEYEEKGIIKGYKAVVNWEKLEDKDVSAIIEVKVAPEPETGFDKIADLFEGVAAIEKEHEERYRKLLANIEGDLVFSKDGDVVWQCANCGHICVGKKAPEVCPVCAHPQSYFQVKAENY